MGIQKHKIEKGRQVWSMGVGRKEIGKGWEGEGEGE